MPSLLVTAVVLSIGLGQMACISPASAQSVERARAEAAAHYGDGMEQINQGDYHGAFEIYDSLIQRYPGQAVLYFLRGLAHSGLREHEAAIADFDEGLRLQPAQPDAALAYYARAREYGTLRDTQRVVEDLDRALRLFVPDAVEVPVAYQLRGVARSVEGDEQGAIEDLRMALDLFVARGDVARAERTRQLLVQVEHEPAETP